MSKPGKKPRGKAQVTAALIEACTQLFAERGIKAVSIRDIADKANVNSALISRHFGGKDGLVEAVLREMVSRFGSTIEFETAPGEQMLAASIQTIIQNPEVMRVFAHMALEGGPTVLSKMHSPYLKETIRQIKIGQDNDELIDTVDARVLLACGYAMGLGWAVFRPLLMEIAGLDKRRSKHLREDIIEFWDDIIHQ